ncbi:MAG TPA: SDR family oxidoreductase [Microvirga sp.]|jgi:3-oxoacyl-[acyl-carrier protein] reductase|nr:SDR family oxidoreductase [Microvirga sp.]
MREVSEHVAVVTGGGGEIGMAIVVALIGAGARVVAQDLDESGLRSVLDSVGGGSDRLTTITGDVSSPEDVDAIFSLCEAKFGRCTLLVNVAGFLHQSPFEKLTVEDWDRMIAVHLRGTFLTNRRAIEPMLEAVDGVIVNISSQLGQIGGVDLAHYSAAKAAVIGLTKSLAREVSSRGVRVNAVAPGPINTKLARSLSPEWQAAKLAELPLRRYGEPSEVAAAVMFLASPSASLFVGQTLGPNSGDVML